MILRAVTLIVVLAILSTTPAAGEQPSGRVHRIGFLAPASRFTPGTPFNPAFEAFRQGLRELGYVEGQNIVLEIREAEGRYERLPDLAAELVRLNVEVIVTDATMAAVAAKRATTTIPIVMGVAADPLASGLVSSLARPGGNITGNSFLSVDLAGKRLELLKQVLPTVSHVAVLMNPGNPTHALIFREGAAAARTLGIQLKSTVVPTASNLASALSAALAKHADALFVLDDPMFGTDRVRIAELAAKSRLPAMYGFRMFVDVGGLMSYGPNLPDLYRRAATYVDKILKGAKPADLPVEQPTKFELVINLKTARSLGLTIPQSVLVRADELIK